MIDIKIDYVFPPIPLRQFDYSAVRDGYDEGDPIGFGETKQKAVDDLISQEEELL